MAFQRFHLFDGHLFTVEPVRRAYCTQSVHYFTPLKPAKHRAATLVQEDISTERDFPTLQPGLRKITLRNPSVLKGPSAVRDDSFAKANEHLMTQKIDLAAVTLFLGVVFDKATRWFPAVVATSEGGHRFMPSNREE